MSAGSSGCYVTPESEQTVQVGSTKARKLEEKLRASSSSTQITGMKETTVEEVNAYFLKYMQQVYAVFKGLEEEVSSTPNH